MDPLVSVLIPAFNAEQTIAQTLRSAVDQTWRKKEIIVVDDGSSDRTADVARSFGSKVKVVSTQNQGASAARNQAFGLCQGDYIQWLDADDLLAPDKIERQLSSLRESDSRFLLLSSPWAPFYYRTRHARYVNNSLCQDLSPIEWLLRKMGENLHMQTATWLSSREIIEAAGLFDTCLSCDDDGEYFCRVLLASEGTRFVAGTGVFYRSSARGSLSHIGDSVEKRESLFRSMKLHIQYLCSLEESERVRKACLAYLQTWYPVFYSRQPDIAAEMRTLAAHFEGHLEEPTLSRKYAWLRPVLGWKAAERAQRSLPQLKASFMRHCDKAIYKTEDA